jgi:hypothetical protein
MENWYEIDLITLIGQWLLYALVVSLEKVKRRFIRASWREWARHEWYDANENLILRPETQNERMDLAHISAKQVNTY